MDRKEKIYEYINSREYIPLNEEELKTMLCVPAEDYDEFSSLLTELTQEGKIFLSKKKRYLSVSAAGLFSGKIRCSSFRKFAILIPSDSAAEELYIPYESLNGALNSDFVICSSNPRLNKGERKVGAVEKITKRNNDLLCGVIIDKSKHHYLIEADSKNIYPTFCVKSTEEHDYVTGERVLFKITDYSNPEKLKAEIIKSLGMHDTVKSQIARIIEEHRIKSEFDTETLLEAQAAPKRVSQKEISNRVDLRNKIIFTIDGDDARDFDDAVSLEITSDQKYLLGVHIADVSEYVKPGSALNKEAFERGTSVYLADRVIPMLPFELSNGICSLNPRVNRLTLSVFMKIDKDGNIEFDRLCKSVIRSSERLTYNDVADLLENPTKKLLNKYKKILPVLQDMHKLADILNEKRHERGSINFDFPEAAITVDENANPVSITHEERRISHKMIEEFMLAANETVAEMAFWAELPFIYRVHEAPDIDKITDFNRFINNFGYGLKGRFDNDTPIHPKAFSSILEKINGTPEEEIISVYMLRSLMKAEYKSENNGHFGLASTYYCHFTSPIRRYPDLFIHRILKAYLDGCELSSYLPERIAKHSSETEREADLCERDTDDLLKTVYMSNHLNEEFCAVISSVTSFGFFVRLENTAEGFIRAETMRDDYYEYDDNTKQLIGKRKNRTYKIGDNLRVILVGCNISERQLDFIRSEDEKLMLNQQIKYDTSKSSKSSVKKKNKRKFGKNHKKNKGRKK